MILFICGIPGSGKSTFGRYLRDDFGYFYIDMEDRWPDEQLHSVWNKIFPPNQKDEVNVKKFVNAVINKSSNSVLDLGFPVNEMYLWIIPLLKKYGCSVLWFECGEDVARRRYVTRDHRPIEWFNTQMTNIKNGWKTIEEKIRPIKINVLKADKSEKTKEELYNELVKLGVINNV